MNLSVIEQCAPHSRVLLSMVLFTVHPSTVCPSLTQLTETPGPLSKNCWRFGLTFRETGGQRQSKRMCITLGVSVILWRHNNVYNLEWVEEER